jgi:nitrite reductase (NADH) small subunit
MKMQWQDVCSVADLHENSGVCAVVNYLQVAIFYLPNDEQGVYAINNYDPIGKANVLSRGIVGDINGEPVVASPLYKQHFNLYTGVCVEDTSVVPVPVYACRIHNDRVEVDTRSVAPLWQFIENSSSNNMRQHGVTT